MGVSHSTARYLAPASFLYDFAAQQYGILSTPSMKDIHDRNLAFWSPNPYFIGAFFFPQQLFQLAWLWRLWKSDPKKSAKDREEADTIRDFVPWYALGNVCIGTWMFFWNNNRLDLSNIFVIVNSCAQLYYVFTKLAQPENQLNLRSPSSILTHVVSKTFAGIGVLDLLHNTSAAYFVDQSPSFLTKILTGVGFGALALAPGTDWIFGGCLVYDLVALTVGQAQWGKDPGWAGLLGAYAVGTAAIVGLKNWFRPPYEESATHFDTAVRIYVSPYLVPQAEKESRNSMFLA
ncbi:MAG: hypothetical protein M1820_001880 [Bogoriella megaspora]|nr:MAG: hypothetical protein M1820_001880 [Bogoriella megaspora]